MPFNLTNPNSLSDVTTTTLRGARAYVRTFGAAPGTPWTDLGAITISNRTKTPDKITVPENLTGIAQTRREIIRGISESLTFASPYNNDDAVSAYHSGAVVVSDATSGIKGWADTGASAVVEMLIEAPSVDAGAPVEFVYFPKGQLSGDGISNQDGVDYPQFVLTALSWGTWVPSAMVAPFVASNKGTKIVLRVPADKTDDLKDDLTGTV